MSEWLPASTQLPRSITIADLYDATPGRLLGRCHAALGEHSLSLSALDAALEVAKAAELLYSEALTVRERALTGNGSGTGKERLVEVMGRMAGDKQLHEKLLLHGV